MKTTRTVLVVSLLLACVAAGKAQNVVIGVTPPVPSCAIAIYDFERQGNGAGITQIEWDFGDGSPHAFGQDKVTHPYSTPGTYTVTMTVTYNGTTVRTDTYQVVVHDVPHFTFSADKDTICPGETVNFTVNFVPPTTSADIASYMWQFGDGTTDTTMSPSHTYLNGQNLDWDVNNLSLRLVTQDGCEDRVDVNGMVVVRRKPVVDFSVDQSIFCLPDNVPTQAVKFNNLTDVTPPISPEPPDIDYKWDFGDGNSSSDKNPTHPYGPGTFNVTLVATDDYGCVGTRTRSSMAQIVNYKVGTIPSDTVVLCDAPDAPFSITGNDPNPAITYYYVFGNGYDAYGLTCATTYHDEGVYTLTVTGYHPSGCESQDTVIVIAYEKVTPLNIVTDTQMCEPKDPVLFKDNTVYGPYAINRGLGKVEWFFGDTANIDPGYDVGDTTRHIYGDFGRYHVKQVVTTPYGCELDTLDILIDIFHLHTVASYFIPQPPSPPEGCVPLDVGVFSVNDSLRTSSPITNYIWRWDYFGVIDVCGVDTTDSDTNFFATHTYQDTGIFDVYLTLINEQGCIDTFRVSRFRVGVEPVNEFTFEYMEDCNSSFSVKVQAYDSLWYGVYDTIAGDTIGYNIIYNSAVHCYDSIYYDPISQDTIKTTIRYLVIDTIRQPILDTNTMVIRIDTVKCLVQVNPYGAAAANEWDWYDLANPMMPISHGKSSSLSFSTKPGYQSAFLTPKHNGCPGIGPTKLNIGYVCPPMSAIDYPKDNMDGTKPVFCYYPNFCDDSLATDGRVTAKLVSDAGPYMGGMKFQWYMGDTVNGLTAMPDLTGFFGTPPAGHNGESTLTGYNFFDPITGASIQYFYVGECDTCDINSVLEQDTNVKYNTNTQQYDTTITQKIIIADTIGVSCDTVISYNAITGQYDTMISCETIIKYNIYDTLTETGGDIHPCFDYAPPDSLRKDTSFYLFKNGGVVLITLEVSNWDSTSNEFLDPYDAFLLWNKKTSEWEEIDSSWVQWNYGDSTGVLIQTTVEEPDSIKVATLNYPRWEVWDNSIPGWKLVDSVLQPTGTMRTVPIEKIYEDSVIHFINGKQPHPTYNRCKYCEDQAIQVVLISDAIMNFTADKYDVVCQGDSVFFYDSTFSSVAMLLWGFGVLSASTPANIEYAVGQYAPAWFNPTALPPQQKQKPDWAFPMPGSLPMYPPIQPPPPVPVGPIEPGSDILYPRVGQGYYLHFEKPNVYSFQMVNMCAFQCVRSDTIEISVWPRSIPDFTTSKSPNGPFNKTPMKALCMNNPDTLYLKDNSTTAYPFNNFEIVNWVWQIDRTGIDSVYGDSVIAVPINNGRGAVALTVTNEKGCDSTLVRDSVFLANYVNASFFTQTKTYCNNVSINFGNRSNVLPLTVHDKAYNFLDPTSLTSEWDWGDGSPKERQTFVCGDQLDKQHTYYLPDKETKVAVTIRTWMTNDSTCSDVFVDTITIIRPIADFTDDGHRFPCPGDLGKEITFTSTSDGRIQTYTWTFGDNWCDPVDNTAVGPDPEFKVVTHTYKKAGYYDVTLMVEDSAQGCVDIMYKPRHVYIDGPAGWFEYAPLSGCVPFNVTFLAHIDTDNDGNYTADSIGWMPDGASVIWKKNAAVILPYDFTYTNPGAYVPMLQLVKTVDMGDGTTDLCVVIEVGEDTVWAIDLQPDFTVDSLYCLDAPVDLINTTEVRPTEPYVLDPDSIYWDFGNGDFLWIHKDIYGEILDRDASTIYLADGAYTIGLTEFYKLCTQTKLYTINVMPWPNLYFSPDTAIACDGLEVILQADTLSDLAKSRIASYEWLFLEDSVALTGNPAQREFTESGLYHYYLKVTFTPKNCDSTWNDSVVIFAFKSPVAEFSADPKSSMSGVISTVETGGTVKFTDKSTQGDGNIDTWNWNFGDGEEGDEQNPSHAYTTTSGYLTVSLEVIDEYGCKNAIQHQILITEKLRFPNIFTPVGSNGGKYVFKPLEAGGFFKQFKLEIYNKWGMLVWSQNCTDPNCPEYENDEFWWDGRNKQGSLVPDGVYYWVVYAEPLSETKPIIKNGSITILNKK